MWVMLIKKLPTNPSPPKMSIFWSTPWPKREWIMSQWRKHFVGPFGLEKIPEGFEYDDKGKRLPWDLFEQKILAFMELQGDFFLDSNLSGGIMGKDPNWAKARAILYKGEKIRIFPHEFSQLLQANMRLYINKSHELVADSVADSQVVQSLEDGDLKEIYDAALVDGCTHSMAIAVALGVDIVDVPQTSLANFPPIGWYRMKKEFAEYFCDQREMEE